MVAVEVEAKLLAPDGVRLPELSGLLRGIVSKPAETVTLHARYYDTADLRLARTGITVRYRSGEGQPRWTLKLPRLSRGSSLSRTEIDFEGPPNQVPGAAVDLVTATSRGELLRSVCELSTLRRRVEILDTRGRLLAVVVDDTVSATPAGRKVAVFREVEVEAYVTGRRAERLLDAAVSRLAAAGCQATTPTPKLVRALGPAASMPSDVAVPSLGRRPGVSDLIGHALAISVLTVVSHDPGVRLGGFPEDVHQLRVGTRRLRSDLRTFAPLLDKPAVATLRREIGWLCDVVGTARDLDVLADRLSSDVDALGGDDRAQGVTLLGVLNAQREAARDALLDALRSRRYLDILDGLVELCSSPPLRPRPALADADLSLVAKRIVRRSLRGVAAAVEHLGDEPSDSQLHSVRIFAKRARYATEAVAPLAPRELGALAVALSEIQELLGDYNDSVVAETWLRGAAERTPPTGLAAGLLIAAERRRRSKLARRWPAEWKRARAGPLARWL